MKTNLDLSSLPVEVRDEIGSRIAPLDRVLWMYVTALGDFLAELEKAVMFEAMTAMQVVPAFHIPNALGIVARFIRGSSFASEFIVAKTIYDFLRARPEYVQAAANIEPLLRAALAAADQAAALKQVANDEASRAETALAVMGEEIKSSPDFLAARANLEAARKAVADAPPVLDLLRLALAPQAAAAPIQGEQRAPADSSADTAHGGVAAAAD